MPAYRAGSERTLGGYAGLFPDHLSEVADRMDDLWVKVNATNDVLTTLKKIDL